MVSGYLRCRLAACGLTIFTFFICVPAGAGSQSASPGAGSPVDFFQTAHDAFPNFTRRPTVVSRQHGPWSAPSTWVQNRVPGENDVVFISSAHNVVYDRTANVALAAVGIAGALRFRPDVSTRLVVGTLFVEPGGSLEVGTRQAPVQSHAVAEIVIANRPLYVASPDPATQVIDPRQYATGLIVLGRITMHGQFRSPTWTRLAADPAAGQQVLILRERVQGWRPGDLVVIPDTRQLPLDHSDTLKLMSEYQTETVPIAAVSLDGKSVTLARPLRHAHRGASNPDGSAAFSASAQRLLPHVGNLTRNVRVRSADPYGVRGHVMFTDRASVDIHQAAWIDLGRTTTANLDSTKVDSSGTVLRIGTNQMARYWVHFHFLSGRSRPEMPRGMTASAIRSWLEQSGWQFEFVGNAIASSTDTPHVFKWAIDVHASHYGKVTDNVIYNAAGSGLQTEDGTESFNLIARNFAVKVSGIGEMLPPVPTSNPDVTHNHGRNGSGFWYRGPHNWMEANVSADARYSGHYLSRYYLVSARNIPRFPGATTGTDLWHTQRLPVLSFADNEAYGPMEVGLYGAWVSGFQDATNWAEIRMERFTSWHPYSQHIRWYHNGKTTFTDLVLRGDPQVSSGPALNGQDVRTVGMRLTLYENVDLTIDRADIRGLPKGIDLPTRTLGGTTRVRNSFFQNYVNLALLTKVNSTQTELANLRFAPFGGGSRKLTYGYNDRDVKVYPYPMNITLDRDLRKMIDGATYVARTVNFNGITGDNFRLYNLTDPSPCKSRRLTINAFTC
jgi:hypothetical protein